MTEDCIVYIGQKPIMNYVLAVVRQFNGEGNEVKIRARGRSISKAVDVALIIEDRFVERSRVNDIKIGTENLQDEEGRPIKVSSIEISMARA